MRTTEIEFGPPGPSYNSFAESVAAAEAQPEQAKAKLDSEAIAGSELEAGKFGQSRCTLQFSNGWHLLAQARDFGVPWAISERGTEVVEPVPRRRLRSAGSGREWEFDPNAMIGSLLGSEFVMLAVTDRALLVYTRGNDILWLRACKERSSGWDFLYACFD